MNRFRWVTGAAGALAAGTVAALLAGSPVHAASLLWVSDLISTSRSGLPADHTITFQTTSAVPPSGKIVLTFDPLFFASTTLEYGDFDFATSSILAGPFGDRTLAATSSASADGVAVQNGYGPVATITLNSTQGIPGSAFVRTEIGLHAAFETSSDAQFVSPVTTNSYHIRIRTEDVGGGLLDEGTAMVAIVPTVTLTGSVLDFDPPIRSNGLPSSTVPAGTPTVEISLNTNELSTCRYATTAGLTYAAMTNSFTTTGSLFHSTQITGITDSTNYTFYVRCNDQYGNANTDDFLISFVVGPPPNGPPVPGGTNQGGPAPGGSGGGYYPAAPGPAIATLSGRSFPNSTVHILVDGKEKSLAKTNTAGDFEIILLNLIQGTYTFGVYGIDASGRKSSAYSTTFTIISGSKNSIAGILTPPTMALEAITVTPGDSTRAFGVSPAFSSVEVRIEPQKSVVLETEVRKQVVQAGVSGLYEASLSTAGLTVGTYVVRARATLAGFGTSNFSQKLLIGVGTAPKADFAARSDINNDHRVNLVDFSILLFHWGTADPIADINADGKVNLADFSILLFNWTG